MINIKPFPERVENKIRAWDMTQSGLYENFSGDRPSVCIGQTIFGLTSLQGQSDIYDINFVSDVDEYVNTTVGISTVTPMSDKEECAIYNLEGKRVKQPHGIYLKKGKKYVRK